MTTYKVKMKDGRELYGTISKVEAVEGKFRLLEKDQLGMHGKDGTEIKFEECLGVYYETRNGNFDSDEQMVEWTRHARKLAMLHPVPR